MLFEPVRDNRYLTVAAPIGHCGADPSRDRRKLRKNAPASGRWKLKHAPPMQANDLPLVAQALPPANCISSQLFRERLLASFTTRPGRLAAAPWVDPPCTRKPW